MEGKKKENIKIRRPTTFKQARLISHNGKLSMSYEVDRLQSKLTDNLKVICYKSQATNTSYISNSATNSFSKTSSLTEKCEIISNREHHNMEEESSTCMKLQLQSASAKLYCDESTYRKVKVNCNIVTNANTVRSSNNSVGKRRNKFRKICQNQLLLDAGQKSLGVTQCTECGFVYHAGIPEEENAHASNHNYLQSCFNFKGWKLERVVERFPSGRILQVLPNDPRPWIKRICKVLEIINREMGYSDPDQNITFKQIYLLMVNSQIVGCLIAETATEGRKMLKQGCSTDLCSEEVYPVKCSISKIWVAQEFRRQGFGSLLMDCLKVNFIEGCSLSNHDIAFGSLTESGRIFANKYFQNLPFYIHGI